MPKMIIAALLSAFLLFSNCNKTQPTPKDRLVVESNEVTVRFSGMMVFHEEKSRHAYEVGILSPAISTAHTFSLDWGGARKLRKDLPTGTSWSLEIVNGSSTPIPPAAGGHDGKRRPDKEGGQFDFDWIIDLEGSEFHKKDLTLKKGFLIPIIHLPANALLATEYKSMDLKRWQGPDSTKTEYFGFVPEVIDLNVRLDPGQQLVLRDDASGKEIFTLPSNPYQKAYVVNVMNVREPPQEASDFGLYYQLFEGIGDAEKYDFKANEESTKLLPLNPYSMRTCCMILCDSVLLGKRSDPLW